VASERLESPSEPAARFATKRQLRWVEDTAQRTETGEEELPHLVTQVPTTLAPAPAGAQLAGMQDALAVRRFLPSDHWVDAASVRALTSVPSQQRDHIDRVGPVATDPRWQAPGAGGFTTACFASDWEARAARCPRGHQSIRGCETATARPRRMIPSDCAPAPCLPCPDRGRCPRAKTAAGARTRTLPPRAEDAARVTGRARQQTQEFAQC
jgi:transposase